MAELRNVFVIDTAKRRRADSIPEGRAEDFHAVVRQNADAMVVIDREGYIRYANPAAEDLFKLPTAELVGMNPGFPLILDKPVELHILREPKDLVTAEIRMVEVVWAGEPSFLLSFRDTTDRVLAERAVNQSGDKLETMVDERTRELSDANVRLVREVAERKRTEEALRTSRARLESVFLAVPAGIGTTVNRVIKEANDKLCEMLGYSWEELADKDARLIYSSDEEYERAGREGYGYPSMAGMGTVETRWRRKDGRIIDVLMSTMRIDPGNAAAGVTFAALDITEHKRTEKALRESEEKYRELVENANSIILRWDMRGRLTFFNEFAEKLLGFSKDEVLGRDVVGTIVPFSESTGRDLKALMEEVKRCPERYQLNVNENVCKNGDRVWIAWTNKAIRDEGGNVVEILSVGNDITERRQAEEALRESERHLARAQQIARIGSWLLDVGENRFYCSDETYRIFGLRPGEIMPSYGDFLGFVHPGDREWVDKAVRDALVRGNYNAEFRIVRNDDSEERYVHSEADTTFDGGGNPVKMEGTVQDITERKRSEESLKLTQFALDNFRDSAIWLSMDKRIIYVNDEACRSLGYTRDELLSMRIWDIDPDVNNTQVVSKWKELKRRGDFATFEQRHIARGGRIFPVEVTASYTRYGDKEYIISFDRDITERKRAEDVLRSSEAKLHALFENAGAAIFLADCATGEILDCNAKAESLTGRSRGELIGLHQTKLHPANRAKAYVEMFSCHTLAGTACESEAVVLHKDGRLIPVMINAAPLKIDGRDVMIGFFLDITDLKRAEGELMAAKMEADLYVDLMCHDISNMNQVGLGFLEMALDMLDLDEMGREMLLKPKSAFENSSRLIENVRKLKRARSGEYPPRDMDIGEVLGKVRDDYARQYGAGVTINCAWNAGCTVKANELLYDLFSNLVGNAIKHARSHPTIDITVEPVCEGGDYYKVGIDDRGPGIPDELKAVIFDRKLTGDTKSKGSGIGLYMAKALTDSYKGRIWAEDRVPGDSSKGSRFVVMLPAMER